MKKLLIALSAAALTLLAATATAEAGHYVRYIVGYNHCGQPIYSHRYVPTTHYSSSHYCPPPPCHSGYSGYHGYRSVHPGYSYGHSHSRPSFHYSYSSLRRYCR